LSEDSGVFVIYILSQISS